MRTYLTAYILIVCSALLASCSSSTKESTAEVNDGFIVKVGDMAPDFTITSIDGKEYSLSALKGKVVMLDFHVFGTKESTQRIMQMRELYNKYHDRGFEIYQVSFNDDEHFWKTQTAALPWISVRDADGVDSKLLMLYNIQKLPTFFLVDKTNTLYKRDEQIKDLDAEIQKIL